ncbi:MAG TPA: hypothetical protein VGC66_20240 [Pyrinomonadaceae bacterium]|jgi:hypothetical protein
MKIRSNFRKITLLIFALALMSVPVGHAQPQEYSFTVRNVGKDRVIKLLASEDGKTWGFFDIGDGIDPGETKTIVWDRTTNNQACVQFFKAAFDDGLESPPKKFDFCKKDLAIDVR